MKVGAAICAVFAAAALLSACEGQRFEPPDRAERVDRAEGVYSPALFDTIRWADEQARLLAGNLVYAEECRRCHGALGEGRTDYARERGLTVPSLVRPGWPKADADSLRHMIFVGHESGMPIYGDGDLSPRQIDATAAYILLSLRPDVLEEG